MIAGKDKGEAATELEPEAADGHEDADADEDADEIAEERDSEGRMTPAQMADFYRGYRETIDRVIDDRLGGVLEELGFVRRKRRLFVLETPVMRKCVAFTSSNRYLGDFEEITGVYVPGLEALVDELCPRDLLPDGVKLGRALGPFAYHAATTAIRTVLKQQREAFLLRHPPRTGWLGFVAPGPQPPSVLDLPPFVYYGRWTTNIGDLTGLAAALAEWWLAYCKPWLDRCDDLTVLARAVRGDADVAAHADCAEAGLCCLAGAVDQARAPLRRMMLGARSYDAILAERRAEWKRRRVAPTAEEERKAVSWRFQREHGFAEIARAMALRYGIDVFAEPAPDTAAPATTPG